MFAERAQSPRFQAYLASAAVSRSAGERQLLSRMPADSKASSIALAMKLGSGSRTARIVVVNSNGKGE